MMRNPRPTPFKAPTTHSTHTAGILPRKTQEEPAVTLAVRQVHPLFVAEVSGVDMRQPPDETLMRQIVAAADEFAVLIFPGQQITDEQHVGFTRPFGRLETTIKAYRPGFKGRLDPHVADISNLDDDSNILAATDRRRMSSLGNRQWHTDYTFKEAAGKYSFLHARVVPEDGGETKFADMRAAYDALPDRIKARLEELTAEHSLLYSRGLIGFTDFTPEEQARLGSSPQLIVRTHPGSKRKTLYLASHAMQIHGVPIPEGRILLHDLIEHATQTAFVYTHRWTPGDMVMWDNRCTMHRACEYDAAKVRELHRTTVMEEASSIVLERALSA
jgi:alpha-ketoglutarate-dependent 2,4-dichlorophenoxyacetate dioxygenase